MSLLDEPSQQSFMRSILTMQRMLYRTCGIIKGVEQGTRRGSAKFCEVMVKSDQIWRSAENGVRNGSVLPPLRP
jgi:hypothetical protein